MKAMLLENLGPVEEGSQPLCYADVAEPAIGNDEVLLRVTACGVCQ